MKIRIEIEIDGEKVLSPEMVIPDGVKKLEMALPEKASAKPAPPPAEVPAPEPGPSDEVLEKVRRVDTRPRKECCGVRGNFHKHDCVNYVEPPAKTCCGSRGVRHKKGCEKASGTSADPEPAAEEPAEAEAAEEQVEEQAPEKAESVPEAASEPPEPEEAQEDQEFVCKECGNTRLEPYGTKALLLSCPNGWADEPDKHVYELKEE